MQRVVGVRKRTKTNEQTRIIMTHASVFSGIGGPEVAATMLGWENLFHCEINPFGRKVLQYWYPNAESYEDITKTDFSKWRGRVSVLTGGFPCQPFSYAGQRRGAEDDRYLWPHMHRCINEIQPDWVVCENVTGITTMVEQGEVSEVASQTSMFDTGDIFHRYRLTETFTLERISKNLESDGYTVQSILIPACAVGAPHRRDRVFIVGHRRGTILENALRSRCMERGNDEHGSERNEWHAGARGGERICGETSRTAPTDTYSRGLSQPEPTRRESEYSQKGARMDNSIEREGKDGNITDTSNERPQAGHRGQGTGETSRNASSGNTRIDSQYGDITGNGRWENFPSVAPVHRGNDGLPFNVDNLTIPFAKWRTEALKAYGNAIVPQVMYEIFRAIEQTEKTYRP